MPARPNTSWSSRAGAAFWSRSTTKPVLLRNSSPAAQTPNPTPVRRRAKSSIVGLAWRCTMPSRSPRRSAAWPWSIASSSFTAATLASATPSSASTLAKERRISASAARSICSLTASQPANSRSRCSTKMGSRPPPVLKFATSLAAFIRHRLSGLHRTFIFIRKSIVPTANT